jgi:hypothetical protein
MNMKSIAIIVAGLLLATSLSAQDYTAKKGTGNDPTRKEKRQAKLAAGFQQTSALLDSRQFVLEADWLSNNRGRRIPVTSSLNFISVDSIQAVIQTGNNTSLGYNGVGGITAEGNITNWKLDKNAKNMTASLRMDVFSHQGNFTIFMEISSSGRATARLSGMRAGQLIYEGRLVPLDTTRVYKGSSL